MAERQIWYTRCPVPTALGLAVQRGTLHEAIAPLGRSLASIQQSGDRATQASHFTHQLASSIRHGGNTPAIFARSEGADTRIVALSWTPTPHPILVRPGSGIETVRNLKGKRLALSLRQNDVIDFWRAAALRAYEAALASEGLTLDDVTLVDLPVARSYLDDSRLIRKPRGPAGLATGGGLQREEVFALIRGEVDAIYSQSSFASELASFVGVETLYDVGQHPDPLERANNALPEAFTVSASLIEEDFEAVATILAASILAADWARDHHREAVRIVASEQRVAEEAVEVAYGPTLTDHLDIDLSPFRVEALGRRKDFLLRHGFIRADFDLDGWIDPRPLARAGEIVAAWKAAGTSGTTDIRSVA
ncbi:MAG: ABC transporter substrate-binding protein [Rhizobiales bacterium]|nr:ABC transporter substrate-binding protein [Hyphomicrobiales bacterium]